MFSEYEIKYALEETASVCGLFLQATWDIKHSKERWFFWNEQNILLWQNLFGQDKSFHEMSKIFCELNSTWTTKECSTGNLLKDHCLCVLLKEKKIKLRKLQSKCVIIKHDLPIPKWNRRYPWELPYTQNCLNLDNGKIFNNPRQVIP